MKQTVILGWRGQHSALPLGYCHHTTLPDLLVRVLMTLIYEIETPNGAKGAVAICPDGGQGTAMLAEV